MIPILSQEQSKLRDQLTILNEPIPSIDLLERACWFLFNKICRHLDSSSKIAIIAGPGNNGADGICLAKLLFQKGYDISLYKTRYSENNSIENSIQLSLVDSISNFPVFYLEDGDIFNLEFDQITIVIDAIFGSGLSRPLNNSYRELIESINQSGCKIYSIDSPTGVTTWETFDDFYVHAEIVFCMGSVCPAVIHRKYQFEIQTVEFGLLEPEVRIGSYLDPENSQDFINSILPNPSKHAHKGSQGHSLCLGGNEGMHGAIALTARACSEVGSGNVTVAGPAGILHYLGNFPRIQFKEFKLDAKTIESIDFNKYNSIIIGPGLGQTALTTSLLSTILNIVKTTPLVLDADALNIISKNKQLLDRIPKGSILTPHPKELSRLFGDFNSLKEQWQALSDIAIRYQINILAKDTYSVLFCADGEVYVNGNGHQKLAKGGSGDILAGLIGGYLAQGLKTKHAAICGMFNQINYVY